MDIKFLKCVLVEHKTLIVKMSQDNPSIIQARLNIDFLCDIHTLLTLYYLLPLLECINALMKFSQERNVFILYFMVVMKIYQVDLFMYINPMTKY